MPTYSRTDLRCLSLGAEIGGAWARRLMSVLIKIRGFKPYTPLIGERIMQHERNNTYANYFDHALSIDPITRRLKFYYEGLSLIHI